MVRLYFDGRENPIPEVVTIAKKTDWDICFDMREDITLPRSGLRLQYKEDGFSSDCEVIRTEGRTVYCAVINPSTPPPQQ